MKTTNQISRLFSTAIAAALIVSGAQAQQITINKNSHLVMNGNVQLVVNNASFKNSGNFNAGTGTVKFSGNNDTAVSNLAGDSNTVFYNLTVSKASYGTALKSSAAVKNTLALEGGNLYTNNQLTLKSDADLTARVAPVPAASRVYGKANIERFIPARRAWRILTAPVTGSNSIFESWQNGGVYQAGINTYVSGPNPNAANGLDASPLNNVSMKTWNANTQGFTNITNTKVAISAGNTGSADNTPYFIFVRGDRTYSNFSTTTCNATTLSSKGTLQQGTQSFTVASKAGAYTMVGNPYASPVDFNNIARTNVKKRFYVWDPTLNTLGGYVMLDDLTNSGTYMKSVAASAQGKDIQSGQGFFVETIANGTASVVFEESSKSSVNNNHVFRPTGGGSQLIKIGLNIISNGTTTVADGTFAEFNEAFSSGIDNDDAMKFTNTNENIALVRNNVVLTAERRAPVESDDTLFVKVWKTVNGTNYQLMLDPSNFVADAVLIDNYTGLRTPVMAFGSTTYSFTTDANSASTAANRFMIVMHSFNVLPVTISSVKAAVQNNNTINVEWKAENEVNIEKYDIEKSANGKDFSAAGTATAKNSGAYNTYNWLDVSANQGANFYRIKVYDRSGEVKYSNIVRVVLNEKAGSSINIYPNPVTNSSINLQFNNQVKGKYQFNLHNNIGQVIYKGSEVMNSGNGTMQLNVPVKLTSGIYQLEVLNPNNERQVLQVIAE